VTIFDDADLVLVDLRAELPSFCARPHVQQAAFFGRREATYRDIEGLGAVDAKDAAIDAFCIAHIRLDFDGASRFYKPRADSHMLYPKPGKGCRVCKKPSDMNGDYLLHILQCYVRHDPKDAPDGFPDRLSGL
jgi:hypothetical protein